MPGGARRIQLALRGGGILLAALVLAWTGLARAEQAQQGNLIVSLDGEISPLRLPRHLFVPAQVSLSGKLATADGSPLPQLHRVEFALAGRGALDTRGLPVCSRRQLSSTTPRGALAHCADALIGSGRLVISVFIPNQPPFDFHASLQAFNGRSAEGHPQIWLHVYGARPPSTFLLPFAVRHPGGEFPTALVATIPPRLGPWPHVADFEMTLGHRFTYRHRLHSYLNADCPLPPRFTAGVFPFARATYTFAGGKTIDTTIVRGCRTGDFPLRSHRTRSPSQKPRALAPTPNHGGSNEQQSHRDPERLNLDRRRPRDPRWARLKLR